jgi:hypothetical protein
MPTPLTRTVLMTAAMAGAIGLGAVGLGLYAMLKTSFSLAVVVVFVLGLIPAGFFLLIAYAAVYFAVTGKRFPQAASVSALLTRANRPLWGHERRHKRGKP